LGVSSGSICEPLPLAVVNINGPMTEVLGTAGSNININVNTSFEDMGVLIPQFAEFPLCLVSYYQPLELA
jgi:hypothetical protein